VVYCIIDTGLDGSHPDFAQAPVSGCGEADGCHAWQQDYGGHGTHVAGTIGAVRNGLGVVGVAGEGARLWMVNVFGFLNSFEESQLGHAWDMCLAEQERLKASVNPAMKMVGS
jgi:serine protease